MARCHLHRCDKPLWWGVIQTQPGGPLTLGHRGSWLVTAIIKERASELSELVFKGQTLLTTVAFWTFLTSHFRGLRCCRWFGGEMASLIVCNRLLFLCNISAVDWAGLIHTPCTLMMFKKLIGHSLALLVRQRVLVA
jgi:hypothetical protein